MQKLNITYILSLCLNWSLTGY